MSEERSGQVVAGKYRVRQCLGAGGTGAVYEAEDLATGKRVALKWLHPHLVDDRNHSERFLREAKMLAKVRHPNVVDLYDVGREQGSFFLVLELLDGESLGARLDRGLGPIPETIELLVGAMRGVAAAHKRGIIHRDLKPDNIFLAREGDEGSLTPKLLDFGISKFAEPDTGEVKLTKTGSVFGTPRYMSLEQVMGRPVDERTDIYSFGVILYEALTGQPPYPATNFHQLIVQLNGLNPMPPRKLRPEIPRELERVILGALSHDREQRPPTIEALIQVLLPFREPWVEPPRRDLERASPSLEIGAARRSPWLLILIAVALCVSAGFGWALASREAPAARVHGGPAQLPVPSEVAATHPQLDATSTAEIPAAAPEDSANDGGSAAPDPDRSDGGGRLVAAASSARLAPPLAKRKPSAADGVTPVQPRTLSREELRRHRTPRMSAEEF